MRDHEPVIIEDFSGLWRRGRHDTVPLNHFSDCENIQFEEGAFKTRDGIDVFLPVSNVIRMYNYVMQEGESILALDSNGDIYHCLLDLGNTIYGPILSIPAMKDFGFVSIAGRAFITPFYTEMNAAGINYQRGLEGEFVYVYLGEGALARKAAGAGPIAGSLVLADAGLGNVEMGVKIFGVCYETDTGFLTQIAYFEAITVAIGGRTILVSNIPISPDPFVIARRLVATVSIPVDIYTGNEEGYQFFFIPEGRIEDNTTTSLAVSFFDVELIADASHLLDILSEIPAGVGLTTYHGRMVQHTSFEDISLMRVSYVGEPEAIDAVSGLVIIPLDGNPITNAQEYRDILYAFKKTRTYAVSDNGDVPSAWPVTVMDQGIGASVHGIASVLDSGGVNIDFLLIVDYSGIMVFNGAYQRPEMTFKVEELWKELDRNDFSNIQILNDSLSQITYMTLPDKKMLIGDYRSAFSPEKIKWCPWRFDVETNTIALVNTNTLIIGAQGHI